VERAIRYVRDSFWAGRTFTTLAECNRQALLWRDQVAHQRRWPGEDGRIVEEVFAEEQQRLLPPPMHPLDADHIETVFSRKVIYVRFDLNDYSIRRPVAAHTRVASDSTVRWWSRDCATGGVGIVQMVLDPLPGSAAENQTQGHSFPAGRLEQAVPKAKLIDAASHKVNRPAVKRCIAKLRLVWRLLCAGC
jgi:hypothetical protein